MTRRNESTGRAVAVAVAIFAAGFGSAAWADTAAEIDAGVKTARDACATQVTGCEAAAAKAQGMLVFPKITEAGLVVGGSYGEGALIVGDKTVGYYSTSSGSIGLQLGAQKLSQIIMFMTPRALEDFQHSSGWQAGADAKVTLIDKGNSADIDTLANNQPVIAFVFGQTGLMGGLSVEGAKIAKIKR
jgi:lipid-binding SYLF domain-containing protein